MNEIIKIEPFDKLDEKCKMTMKSFKEMAEVGDITNDDGFGYYATEDGVSHEYVDFDDVLDNAYPDWATHVCWYNA